MNKKIAMIICIFLSCSVFYPTYNSEKMIPKLTGSISWANNTGALPSINLLLLLRCSEIYDWLCKWQDKNSGLMASHEDNWASTYNNAIAAMVFILQGDSDRAEKIFDFFNSRMNEAEFFVNGNAEGFYQFRDSTTGIPFNSDRWFGDNAFLLMALNYYKNKTGSTTYDNMAHQIADWIISLQNSDGSIANGHTEGNLDAYSALKGHGNAAHAQRVKDWLECASNRNWKDGPLDIHSWRVLSLGGDYGFCLNNTQAHKRNSTCTCSGNESTGFVADPAREDNVWLEGTIGMLLALYKAGYDTLGNYYLNEITKCTFCSKNPEAKTLPFLGKRDTVDTWADPCKGHMASVCWYFFALKRFNPFDGQTIGIMAKQNPIIQVQAESYITTTGETRLDDSGCPLEGSAVHMAGDDNISCSFVTCPNSAEYEFYSLESIPNANISVRYADDVGGELCNVYIDTQLKHTFTSTDTGTWNDYTTTPPTAIGNLSAGDHSMQVTCEDAGTWGVTIDAVNITQ